MANRIQPERPRAAAPGQAWNGLVARIDLRRADPAMIATGFVVTAGDRIKIEF